MLSILGYNFLLDGDCLNPSPCLNDSYTDIKLKNGIFDHWNITQKVDEPYSPTIPTAWDFFTLINANFNGNLDAGNLDAAEFVTQIKIKRRKTNEFNWVTLKTIDITDNDSLNFSFEDNLAQSGVEYEYALVPVIQGNEGNFISDKIESQFDGVFICDYDTIYKFYAGASYGNAEQVQKIGVFEPFGRKYPVVVSNALLNYHKGSVSGTVLPTNYLEKGELNRNEMVEERQKLLTFLTNKKAKILKDWNGNFWLFILSNSPTTSFDNKSGMGLADVNIEYVEIGDANSGQDLYDAGILKEKQQ